MFRPLRNWREAGRYVRGCVLECGRVLPAGSPEAMLRDMRRFLARV